MLRASPEVGAVKGRSIDSAAESGPVTTAASLDLRVATHLRPVGAG